MLRNIRTQVLIKLIRPYTRIAIPFISIEIGVESSEVEGLLVSCILDKYVLKYIKLIHVVTNGFFSTIQGRIDQVNQVLELDKETKCAARYSAMDKWSQQIYTLQLAVINKMA